MLVGSFIIILLCVDVGLVSEESFAEVEDRVVDGHAEAAVVGYEVSGEDTVVGFGPLD